MQVFAIVSLEFCRADDITRQDCINFVFINLHFLSHYDRVIQVISLVIAKYKPLYLYWIVSHNKSSRYGIMQHDSGRLLETCGNGIVGECEKMMTR